MQHSHFLCKSTLDKRKKNGLLDEYCNTAVKPHLYLLMEPCNSSFSTKVRAALYIYLSSFLLPQG